MTTAEIIALLAEEADKEAVDIALDEDGDLLFIDGDLVWTRGQVASMQSISISLDMQQGEWFLDETAGIPYYTEVLVKNPNLPAIREHFRKAIIDSYGVAEVLKVDISIDRETRTATIDWAALLDTDEPAEGTEQVTF